jgi:tol-pal system protein YbgF
MGRESPGCIQNHFPIAGTAMNSHSKMTAAILIMAALFLSGGCAMKRDVIRVEEKTDAILADQSQTKKAVMHLDSLLNSDAEASKELRAEIRSSVGDLMEQFQAMQANMNDMQDKIGQMSQGQSGRSSIATPSRPSDSAVSDTTGITAPPGVDCQVLYDNSFVNIRRGQYDDAIKGFNDYLKYCGTEELAADAHYWLGESYYSLEKYKDGIAEFDNVVKNYATSKKRSGAMYKMARCYEELGQKKDAKVIFKKIVDEYPSTLEASQAKEKLKELK